MRVRESMELEKRGIREIEKDSFENYRQNYPENYPLCTFKNVLENLVENIPDKTAFIQGERELTWEQFDERTNKVARFLLNLGLEKGDRVGINGFNSIEWMEAFWGASKAGFAPVNLNPRHVGGECKYVLEDSDAVVLFTEDRWVDTLEEIRKDLPLLKKIIVYNAPGYSEKEIPTDPIYEHYENVMRRELATKPELDWEIKNDDLCYFKYTGGTTGYPKGVIFDNWRGCGSMKWGMISTAFDSGWEKLAPTKTVKALIEVFASKIPGLDISDPSVLKSKKVKEIVLQQLPSLFAQPFFYKLLGGTTITLYPVPPFHGLGFNNNMMWICTQGATSVYLEPAHPFDAKLFWETIEKRKVAATAIAGDAFAIPLIEELERAEREGRPYDTSSLAIIASSGVRWSAYLKRRFLDKIPQSSITDGYGIAESVGGYSFVSNSTDEKITEHTTPVMDSFGYAAKRLVLDLDTGKPAKLGSRRAQFLYGGPHVGLGYWKAPEKTKKTFVDINGERWVISGDEGYVDENGGFHLVGRGGGYVINTGGEKVYSEEVEEVIKGNPKVRDAAVIGIPDKRWGEAVTAIVELNPGDKASKDEIIEYCRGKIAGYKIPKNIIFHKVLRKETGKIERSEMTKLFLAESELERQNRSV